MKAVWEVYGNLLCCELIKNIIKKRNLNFFINNAASRSQRLLNKNPICQAWIPLYEVLIMKAPEGPQSNVYCHSFQLCTRLHGKRLLQKMPHTLVTGHTEIEFELIWKLPPADQHCQQKLCKSLRGEKAINDLTQSWTLHGTVLICQASSAEHCNSGMHVMYGVTNHFQLDFRSTPSEGFHS